MKLAFLGDIALFGHLSLRNNKGVYNYFSEVEQYLATCDYVVGNLESPFSEKKRTYGAKSAYLYSDPENIEVLKYLHIDIVNLANNHVFDYGKEGLALTKELLILNGIDYFGVDGREVKVEEGNNKLSFVGFCCYSSGPQGCVKYGGPGVNEFNLNDAKNTIKRNKEAGYLSIASVHAGIEHVNYPSIDTIRAARKLADAGPIIYYGHHPHVAQGIEMTKESLIAYSLGNFCFDDVYSSVSKKPLIELSENNRSSFILEVIIEHNQICSYRIVPIYIGKDKMYLCKGVSNSDIINYTNAIYNMNECEYTSFRNSIINEYLNSRKSQRNIEWYFKRLRPRYIRIYINSKIRKQKYFNCVTKFL